MEEAETISLEDVVASLVSLVEGVVDEKLEALSSLRHPDTESAYLIWNFEAAPKELQDLSNNGGDEDWVVYIPKDNVDKQWCRWLDHIDSCYSPQRIKLECGAEVYIGSHA